MRDPPRWFRGSLRRAYRVALLEFQNTQSAASWKLFELIPRLLLRRTRAQGKAGRKELETRMDSVLRGDWDMLLQEARRSAHQGPARRRSAPDDDSTLRRERACTLVRLGEVSRARQALTSPALALGNEATLRELQDPALRPPALTEELPEEAMSLRPETPLQLDNNFLIRALRGARRGSAPGLSGTRAEHLKVLLEDEHTWDLFSQLANAYARGEVPEDIAAGLSMGRLTALSKPGGRVRGIVTGATFRRVVARAMAMQFSKRFEEAAAPYQFALSTRAGADAVAHALRALSEQNPDVVILSLDGIGAYDHVKRAAMLRKLGTEALHSLLPYVRMTYARQSCYL